MDNWNKSKSVRSVFKPLKVFDFPKGLRQFFVQRKLQTVPNKKSKYKIEASNKDRNWISWFGKIIHVNFGLQLYDSETKIIKYIAS